MTGLSVSLTSVSAVARGIAEADSVGIAANAQAATPISNKRFMRELSLDGRFSAAGRECRRDRRVPRNPHRLNVSRRSGNSTVVNIAHAA
jgi:hypothetical protein